MRPPAVDLFVRSLLFGLCALAWLALAPSQALAQCAVCQPCATATDCGAGYVCRDLGAPAGMRCTQLCSPGSCPGDSVCYNFTFNGQTEMICLNPDAATAGNCPPSYTCTDDGLSCSGLGTDCASGPGACSLLEANTCLTATDSQGVTRSYCTCPCTSTADCDGKGTCASASSGQMFCMLDSTSGLCQGVTCPSGQVCDPGTGNCVSDSGDLCQGVTCPPGGLCSPATGTCIGGDADASDDMTADTSEGDTSAPADTVGSDTSAADTVGSDTSPVPGAFVLASISPSSGLRDRGQLVQITGQGFVAGMTLRLDATPLTGVTVASPTFATASVPADMGVGLYSLHGQLPDGTQYTLADVYQVNPVDAVDGSPLSAEGEAGCGCRSVRGVPLAPRGPLALAALMGMLAGLFSLGRWRR